MLLILDQNLPVKILSEMQFQVKRTSLAAAVSSSPTLHSHLLSSTFSEYKSTIAQEGEENPPESSTHLA